METESHYPPATHSSQSAKRPKKTKGRRLRGTTLTISKKSKENILFSGVQDNLASPHSNHVLVLASW